MVKTKTLFILGSGCSSEAGIPNLKDFLKYIFKTGRINSNESQPKIDELKKYLDDNLGDCNIEEFLSYLDFISTIKGKESKEFEYRDWLREIITKTLNFCLTKLDSKKEYKYRFFSDTAMRHECSIITFNWDTLLDKHLHYNYGSQNIKPFDNILKFSPTVSRLFKLHGSMNWSFSIESKQITFHTDVDSQKAPYTPFIIPPTYMKFYSEDADSKFYDRYKALEDIWREAYFEIIKSNKIFIIGFSFPEVDQHFKLFLQSALHKCNKKPDIYILTKPKRLLVDKLNFESKYTEILEKRMNVKPNFYYMTFFNFIDKILIDGYSDGLGCEEKWNKTMERLEQYK